MKMRGHKIIFKAQVVFKIVNYLLFGLINQLVKDKTLSKHFFQEKCETNVQEEKHVGKNFVPNFWGLTWGATNR